MLARRFFGWLIVLLALPQLARAAAPAYTLTPVAGKYTSAVALNDAGQIAINNLASDVPYRIGSISGATMSESVGTLGGSESFIRGLNSHGEAVGSSQTASGANHAFLYSGGRIQDLTLAYGLSSAVDINDRGDIAGQAGERSAVLRSGGAVEVFGPPGSTAACVNGAGDVAGDFLIEGKGIHAFLYSEGRFMDLGTLGGSFSTATAVNDAGSIVGTGATGSGQSHAFLSNDGVMTDLGPSATSSVANGINNRGQIVGSIDGHAFLYAGGTMTDLNTLIAPDAGFLLVSALAINDRQQILANACDPSGTFCYSAVRLDPISPIPEPTAIRMLLAGALLLGMHGISRCARTRIILGKFSLASLSPLLQPCQYQSCGDRRTSHGCDHQPKTIRMLSQGNASNVHPQQSGDDVNRQCQNRHDGQYKQAAAIFFFDTRRQLFLQQLDSFIERGHVVQFGRKFFGRLPQVLGIRVCHPSGRLLQQAKERRWLRRE